jgi:menaquinone-dependent protoporphyrinogen oxidase
VAEWARCQPSLGYSAPRSPSERKFENFEQQTGWRPVQIGLFSGALLYRQYGFLKRLMMKRIVSSKPGNLSTDTSRDHEYTEWDAVERFAEDFLNRLVPEEATKIKS